jgi:hypothetical protein
MDYTVSRKPTEVVNNIFIVSSNKSIYRVVDKNKRSINIKYIKIKI